MEPKSTVAGIPIIEQACRLAMETSTIDVHPWESGPPELSRPRPMTGDEMLPGASGLLVELFAATAVATGHDELLSAVSQIVKPLIGGASIQYIESSANETRSRRDDDPAGACRRACETGRVVVESVQSGRTLVAAPVPGLVHCHSALVALVPAATDIERLKMVLQLAAAQWLVWNSLNDSRQLEQSARSSAVIVELITRIESSGSLSQAAIVLVNELQEHFGCQRVALGTRAAVGGRRCRLRAISGVSQFDRRSELSRAIESAMEEAILRDSFSIWPSKREADRHAMLAHERLCGIADAQTIATCPLRDQQQRVIGVCLLLDSKPLAAHSPAIQLLRAGEPSLASSLVLLRGYELGPLGRAAQWLAGRIRTWRFRAVLLLLAVLTAAMFVPVPYRIRCDCQIEPVTRRFIPAPFKGTLLRVLVEPGQVVAKGDLLAQMDERQIRWELAGLRAEHKQAEKNRDSAMAEKKFAAAQVHKLEMETLDVKMQLLLDRTEHLEIKSPIDGIVTGGDLKRAEGAPLEVGQALFEVAPLDQMIFEIAVPDAEIAHVRPGMPVAIALDAYPSQRWSAQLSQLHPRSEMKDNQNVFIGEVAVNNDDGQLRPGMKGQAKIIASRRSLGWILLHKPWQAIAKYWW